MSAVILAMPAKLQRKAKRRLAGVELAAEHSWIMAHRDDWKNAEMDGRKYLGAPDAALRSRLNQILGLKEKSAAVMRVDIRAGRDQITTRNAIKDWMRTHDATDADLATQEAALVFLFGRLQGSGAGHVTAAPKRQRIVPPLAEVADAWAEKTLFEARRQTMLKAQIRKGLGAAPATPKLSIVKSHAPADQAD